MEPGIVAFVQSIEATQCIENPLSRLDHLDGEGLTTRGLHPRAPTPPAEITETDDSKSESSG